MQISSKVTNKTKIRNEESALVKEWLQANFLGNEKQYKPAFH